MLLDNRIMLSGTMTMQFALMVCIVYLILLRINDYHSYIQSSYIFLYLKREREREREIERSTKWFCDNLMVKVKMRKIILIRNKILQIFK